jgi:hypothetical protein
MAICKLCYKHIQQKYTLSHHMWHLVKGPIELFDKVYLNGKLMIKPFLEKGIYKKAQT